MDEAADPESSPADDAAIVELALPRVDAATLKVLRQGR
jgi:hypothetical protein